MSAPLDFASDDLYVPCGDCGETPGASARCRSCDGRGWFVVTAAELRRFEAERARERDAA